MAQLTSPHTNEQAAQLAEVMARRVTVQPGQAKQGQGRVARCSNGQDKQCCTHRRRHHHRRHAKLIGVVSVRCARLQRPACPEPRT